MLCVGKRDLNILMWRNPACVGDHDDLGAVKIIQEQVCSAAQRNQNQKRHEITESMPTARHAFPPGRGPAYESKSSRKNVFSPPIQFEDDSAERRLKYPSAVQWPDEESPPRLQCRQGFSCRQEQEGTRTCCGTGSAPRLPGGRLSWLWSHPCA